MRGRGAVVVMFMMGFLGTSWSTVSAGQEGLLMADAVAVAQAQPVLGSEQMIRPQGPAPRAEPYYRADQRPRWAVPMHVVTAVMQGLDAHSTFKGFEAGAVEANPVVASFAHNRPAFTAFKMGVAAGIIFATDRLAKRHPVRAFITATAINSAYAFVAAHNYRLARELR